MKRHKYFSFMMIGISLIMVTLACGRSSAKKEPQAAIAPVTIGSDLTQVDLCKAIPVEDIEAVMGRKLVGKPQRFEYYDASGTSGCTYDAGKDASGNAYFGYVVLTPLEVYDNQPLYLNVDVPGIGDSAYFNNGADARQLWVKSGRVAFVVAFGDQAEEEGAKAIARLVIAALK
jgi:hypothetical protein